MAIETPAYDSGTEANTEIRDIIGFDFNPLRGDTNARIHLHPGIISRDDGLSTSELTQASRWDNPVVRIVITRIR